MQVGLELAYAVRLSRAEVRLIGLALARKLSKQEDIRAALQLNERLCDLQVHELTTAIEVAKGAHEKASAAVRDASTTEG